MSTPILVSVQVGRPRRHGTADSTHPLDRPWESGIFKEAVAGPVWLGDLNLAGDAQADLENHGGPDKAVLGYSADRYPEWREELGIPDMPYGGFGENFTIAGLDERTVCIGDTWAVGEALVQVSQPRLPCWKLARRWRLRDLPGRVVEGARGGWYYRVIGEGFVRSPQPMRLLERPCPELTVARVLLAYRDGAEDSMRRTLASCRFLSPAWREGFRP